MTAAARSPRPLRVWTRESGLHDPTPPGSARAGNKQAVSLAVVDVLNVPRLSPQAPDPRNQRHRLPGTDGRPSRVD